MAETANIVATIIDDLRTNAYGLLMLDVDGTDMAIQICIVNVSGAGREVAHHLVVSAHYPELEPGLCEQIAARLQERFGEAAICFTIKDAEGKSDVFIPARQRGYFSLLSVATAVAVMKRSWGCDESDWIEIRNIETKELVKVSPTYDGGPWQIAIHP